MPSVGGFQDYSCIIVLRFDISASLAFQCVRKVVSNRGTKLILYCLENVEASTRPPRPVTRIASPFYFTIKLRQAVF
jgi:hypothetical protein